jgi:hypothetical protein
MKLTIQIPKSWNSCSTSQLIKLALLMNSSFIGKKFDYKCFRILVSEKWWHIHTKAKLVYLLSYAPLDSIKESFQYIYSGITLTRFPEIKSLNGNQYHSPLNQISNLTILEMAVADDLHIQYRNTQDIKILPYLAATLYVQQKQPRPPYDKNDLSFKIDDFKKLSLGELLVIEMAFAGCKEYLALKFTKVFPKPKETSTEQSTKKAVNSQFPKLILELSGGKFGTYEQTCRTNCYTFLAEFDNLIKNQKS